MPDRAGGKWRGKRMYGRIDGDFLRLFVRSAVALAMVASLSGCAGPLTVTEYVDGMETGRETVRYDDNGHPEIIPEEGYVANPYAESYSIEKEDFQRRGAGVVPD
jgi:hypothetical protein